MPKKLRRAVILVKNEAVAGTDAVPTAAANAILVRNLDVSPLEQEVEDRNLVRPYLGNSDRVQVSRWFKASFEVELAGAGAAGTAPKYGPVLRAAGFAETISAGVKVDYHLVSEAFETASVYINIDGTLHKSTYGSMNAAWSMDSRKIPFFKFELVGLFVPVVDDAVPTPVYTGFQKPVAVNKQNTTLTLHAYAAVVESLQFDLKNEIPYRNLVNSESVTINDRKPEGSISMEAVSVATKDWWTSIANGTTGPLQVVHGTQAGNIVEINAPTVQVYQPKFADSQGIQMLQGTLVFAPGATGNDEISITVK